MATDINMNTRLPSSDAANGFVRGKQSQPPASQATPSGSVNTAPASAHRAVRASGSQSVKQIVAENEQQRQAERQNPAGGSARSESLGEQSKRELEDTVRKLNDTLQNVQRNLEFSVDSDLGRIVIQVKDKKTDEIVRQIPSEEVLELARNLQQLSEKYSEQHDPRFKSGAEGVFLKTKV